MVIETLEAMNLDTLNRENCLRPLSGAWERVYKDKAIWVRLLKLDLFSKQEDPKKIRDQ